MCMNIRVLYNITSSNRIRIRNRIRNRIRARIRYRRRNINTILMATRKHNLNHTRRIVHV